MGLLASSATLLFAAIGKTIVGTIFNDKPFYQNISQEVIDKIKSVFESPSVREQAAKTIDELAARVVQDLRPLLTSEMGIIDEGGMRSVLIEVDTALNATKIDVQTLINQQLNSTQLKTHILDANPRATRSFSTDEIALYQRIVDEISAAIMSIVPQLPEFEATLSQFVVGKLDNIEAGVEALQSARGREFQAFEERYRRSLILELDRFEYFGIKRMNDIYNSQKLSNAYTNISASIPIKSLFLDKINEKDELLLSDVIQYTLESNISKNIFIESEDVKKSIIRNIVDSEKFILDMEKGIKIALKIQSIRGCGIRIVLRGDAGAGKSTFLQWIGLLVAKHPQEKELIKLKNTVPFFIRLRTLVNHTFPIPDDFPSLVTPNYGGNVPKGWVQSLLETGNALVLIDGVDELPHSQRDIFFQSLRRLVNDFPAAHYIITSRPGGLLDKNGLEWNEWEDWVQKEKFIDFILNPMSIGDIQSFIERWYTALHIQRPNYPQSLILSQIRTLQSLLAQRPEIKILASNPLLCAMICALYHERQETLPRERSKLYQECVELMISRRDETRRVPLDEDYPSNWSDEQKIGFLQKLASWLMRNGRSDAERDDVDEQFGIYLPATGLPSNITGANIRRFFVERAAILREPILGTIDFAHRTFQEYFAAKAMLNENSIDELLNYATNDQWRETIVIAVGLARSKERTRFLNKLLDNSEKQIEQKSYLRILALSCLETSSEVEVNLRERILDKAYDLLPPDSIEDIPKIARLGDTVVPLLAYDPFSNTQEMLMSIETLAHIGTPLALKILQEYTKETDIVIIRRIAAFYHFFNSQQYQEYILPYISSFFIENPTSIILKIINEQLNIKNLSVVSIEESVTHQLGQLTNLLGLTIQKTPDLTPIWNLLTLKELSLNISNNHNLTGIENLKNLTMLHLDFKTNQALDISRLTYLSQLQVLQLDNRPIMLDLSPLKEVESLSELRLHETRSRRTDENIVHIPEIPSLQRLYMYDYNIKSKTSLNMPLLKTLGIVQSDPYQKFDINFINNLNSLENLGLSLNSSESIPLPQLDNLKLRHLQLCGRLINNLNFISSQTSIESIQIGKLSWQNAIFTVPQMHIDITAVSSLTNLQEISFHNRQLIDFDVLGSLKNLCRLRMRLTEDGTDLQSIKVLEVLEVLEIYGDIPFNIEQLGSLKALKHLKIIGISDGSLDMEAIKDFPALETLNIQSTRVKNFETLNTMTHLKFYGDRQLRRQWLKMGGELFKPQSMFHDHI